MVFVYKNISNSGEPMMDDYQDEILDSRASERDYLEPADDATEM